MSEPRRPLDLQAALADVMAGRTPQAGIRPEILGSWRRLARLGLDPERVEAPYDPQPEASERLVRIAMPVLEPFVATLEGSPMSLILADSDARVVRRFVGDPGRRQRVDRASCAPGFCFPEHRAGTNGIGTPLELRRPLLVAAGEHYGAPFRRFTCAGAPVRHPLTGRIEGVVTLVTWTAETSCLMLPVVRRLVEDITEWLLISASEDERLLLAAFLDMNRRSPHPVAAMNAEILLTNRPAARILDGFDQLVLWERVADHLAPGGHADNPAVLAVADQEVNCHTVVKGRRVVGAVLEFIVVPESAAQATEPVGPPAFLPGLVGDGPAWRRLCGEIIGVRATPRHIVTVGEPGTGKLAVVKAGLLGSAPGDAPVFDCAGIEAIGLPSWLGKVAAILAGAPDAAVLRHLEALDPGAVAGLLPVLGAYVEDGGLLRGTLSADADHDTPANVVIEHFGCVQVRVPPLRARPEDIGALVRCAVAEVTSDPRRTIGPEVLQLFLRLRWPGNIRQLRTVVCSAVVARAVGPVTLSDLPPELLRSGTRRPLTPIDQAGYDAILEALRATEGNKVQAANRLGISRSTLYRLVKVYGLDLDRAFF